jgi:hypothetical protein
MLLHNTSLISVVVIVIDVVDVKNDIDVVCKEKLTRIVFF